MNDSINPERNTQVDPEDAEWGVADYAPATEIPIEEVPPYPTHIPVTTGSFDDFTRAVKARCYTHLADLGLEEDYLENLATQFALRFDSIFQKYRQGQLEHGGDIRDRDLMREIRMEIDDLLVYSIIHSTLLPQSISIRV